MATINYKQTGKKYRVKNQDGSWDEISFEADESDVKRADGSNSLGSDDFNSEINTQQVRPAINSIWNKFGNYYTKTESDDNYYNKSYINGHFLTIDDAAKTYVTAQQLTNEGYLTTDNVNKIVGQALGTYATTEYVNKVDSNNWTNTTTYVDGQVNTLKTNFQAGVNTIYNACVNAGETPASSTPTDCATAIATLGNKGSGDRQIFFTELKHTPNGSEGGNGSSSVLTLQIGFGTWGYSNISFKSAVWEGGRVSVSPYDFNTNYNWQWVSRYNAGSGGIYICDSDQNPIYSYRAFYDGSGNVSVSGIDWKTYPFIKIVLTYGSGGSSGSSITELTIS